MSTRPPVAAPRWTPWRTVVGFGVVSLAADMVYEGARSITGPFLASLGASALRGRPRHRRRRGRRARAAAGLRAAGRPHRPLLVPDDRRLRADRGLRPADGASRRSSVAPASRSARAMVLLERTGKAVRSPSKSALLAHAAGAVGRGRGFAVHKALDQVGAFAGPLLVAGVIALTAPVGRAGRRSPCPGRSRWHCCCSCAPGCPTRPSRRGAPATIRAGRQARPPGARLPGRFYALRDLVRGQHARADDLRHHLLPPRRRRTWSARPWCRWSTRSRWRSRRSPRWSTGFAYDRVGAACCSCCRCWWRAVPLLALATALGCGARRRAGLGRGGRGPGLHGQGAGGRPGAAPRLATAYGVFAAFQGAAALAGGALAGWLYGGGGADLVVVVALCQAVSLVLLVRVLRRRRRQLPVRLLPAPLVAEGGPRASCTVEVTRRRSGETVVRARITRAGTGRARSPWC